MWCVQNDTKFTIIKYIISLSLFSNILQSAVIPYMVIAVLFMDCSDFEC